MSPHSDPGAEKMLVGGSAVGVAPTVLTRRAAIPALRTICVDRVTRLLVSAASRNDRKYLEVSLLIYTVRGY